jgi:hypothetical protein
VADISKELSRRWHSLDEVTRSMFEEMATNDKQRFQREKAEYNMNPKGGYKQTRAKRDPNAPKRPLCGFMYFSAEERGKVRVENPNFAVGQIGKELGRRWAAATPETRAKFNEMATVDKERFVREKSEYQMTPYANQWQRGQRAKKDPNAPKRNVHAFMWFSSEERASVRVERPGAGVGEVAKVLSARWAVCPPAQKAKYEQMAFQDKQRYEKEKHEWHMEQRQNALEQQNQQVQRPSPSMSQNSAQSSSSSTYNGSSAQPSQPKTQSWSQPHPTHGGALPPISHVHPAQSPPISNHHNQAPSHTIRYGY